MIYCVVCMVYVLCGMCVCMCMDGDTTLDQGILAYQGILPTEPVCLLFTQPRESIFRQLGAIFVFTDRLMRAWREKSDFQTALGSQMNASSPPWLFMEAHE